MVSSALYLAERPKGPILGASMFSKGSIELISVLISLDSLFYYSLPAKGCASLLLLEGDIETGSLEDIFPIKGYVSLRLAFSRLYIAISTTCTCF